MPNLVKTAVDSFGDAARLRLHSMDVRYVANLARIELTDDEAERYQKQLDDILGYIEQLETVDVEGIEPTAHANPVFDVMREDASHDLCLSAEEALANAPETAQGQFKMPKVVE